MISIRIKMNEKIYHTVFGLGLASGIGIVAYSFLIINDVTKFSNRESVVEYYDAKEGLEAFIEQRDELLDSRIKFKGNIDYQKSIDIEMAYGVNIEKISAADRLVEKERERLSELERDPVVQKHNEILSFRKHVRYPAFFGGMSIMFGSLFMILKKLEFG